MYRTVLFVALLPFVSSFLTGLLSLITPDRECCPDGECYDLRSPWTTLTRPVPPPSCLKPPVKYLLCDRSNPTYPVVFTTANFSKIKSYYNPSKPTVIVFHGYLESEDTNYMRNIIGVYLTRVDANAIFVDCKDIARNINYFQSVSDIRVVARYVAKAVLYLTELGTSPSMIHLIGFSLGAHCAYYAAKAIPGIGRLTGLDPAGPGFTGEGREVKFGKGYAEFTEAIHTNGHPYKGFGTSDLNVADVDLLVNGGWDQPGCMLAVYEVTPLAVFLDPNFQPDPNGLACSHFRCPLIYSEALASNCTMWGVKSNAIVLLASLLTLGYATEFLVNTADCTLGTCVPIGLQTINATGRGSFIVPTNYQSPFCVSQS